MNDGKTLNITREDLETLIKKCATQAACEFPTTKIQDAVKLGINDVLKGMGFDTDHPLEIQRDLIFVRDVRHGTEKAKTKVTMGIIAITVAAMIALFWDGVVGSIRKSLGGP